MDRMALPLSGWRVVVTGDVPGMTRDAAQEAVRMMGGTAASSVTPATDLLVVGAGAGAAKLARASELRIRRLAAEPFAELAENPDRWDGRPLGTVPEGEDDPAADAPPERPVTPSVRRPAQHPAGLTTFTRDGRWTAVARCRCGHGSTGPTSAAAEAGHRAHRIAVGDLDPSEQADPAR